MSGANNYPDGRLFYLIILIVVTGFIFDHRNWIFEYWNWIADSENASTISALSGLAITLLTLFLAHDSRKNRGFVHEQSIRPLLDFSHTASEPYKICLKNNGVAPAINIKIIISEPKLIGISESDRTVFDKKMKEAIENNSILNRTILSLGPNHEITRILEIQEIYIWSYQAKVTIEFENIEGRKYFTVSHLDFSEIEGLDY